MENRVYLSIDAGTSRVKAALIDDRGTLLEVAGVDAPVLHPAEGHCEMDMAGLWELFCSLTNRLATSRPELWAKLSGMGIAAQGDGLWCIDKDGSPTGNAILWNDVRVRDLELPDREGIDAYLREHHSITLSTSSLPFQLCWVKKHKPEIYARIAHVFHCKDWLNFKLTGEIATDYSDRSNASTDIFTMQLLPEALRMMGIPESVDMHPPCYPSTHILGGVSAEASRKSGIPEGLPVMMGAIDVAAVCLGAGAVNVGDKCTILGTTLCNEVLISADQVNHNTGVGGGILRSIIPDKYLWVMAAQSGTASIGWARGMLAPNMPVAELDATVEKVPMGARGILYHPYVYGERAPFRNPSACGGFYGLRTEHTAMDMMRAVYEGVILSMIDCYNHLPQGEGSLYISGGGSNCDLLCELTAHGLNMPVIRPAGKELGIIGIGAALRVALGHTDDYTPTWQEGAKSFAPQSTQHTQLQNLYNQFVALRPCLEPFWSARGSL